jgi:hypothetical protein
LEPQDYPEQGHEIHPVLPSLRWEAVLPPDLEYGSPKVKGYNEGANQWAREDLLDQLDEARTVALMHSARYKQALRRYLAQKIRRRDFNEVDLVLRLRQDK